jgi:hypothetical protein
LNASGSEIIYPYFDKLYKINKDGSGLTKIYQTTDGRFISECDWVMMVQNRFEN